MAVGLDGTETSIYIPFFKIPKSLSQPQAPVSPTFRLFFKRPLSRCELGAQLGCYTIYPDPVSWDQPGLREEGTLSQGLAGVSTPWSLGPRDHAHIVRSSFLHMGLILKQHRLTRHHSFVYALPPTPNTLPCPLLNSTQVIGPGSSPCWAKEQGQLGRVEQTWLYACTVRVGC